MDMVATESSMHGPNGCDGRVCLHENRTQSYSRLRFFSQVHSLTSRNFRLSLAVRVLNCLHNDTAKERIKAGVGQVRAQTGQYKQAAVEMDTVNNTTSFFHLQCKCV